MFDATSLINKQNSLFNNQIANFPAMHIAFCFDTNYVFPTQIAISSIINNNDNKNLIFHLFANKVTWEKLVDFNKFNHYKNVSIICYEINEKFAINPETLVLHVSAATCLRFIVPKILADITDRILYMDCDMLCLANFDELIGINLTDKYAAVVPDVDKTQEKQCPDCNITYGNYFNAGMMYINIDMWLKNDITTKAFALINSGRIFKFADQDVLNILMQDNVTYLPRKYNNIVALTAGGIEDKALANDTVIIHYVSGNKPWFRLYLTPTYEKYIQQSPWANSKLSLTNENAPSTTRRYAKLLASQGKYLQACYYYGLYLKHKLIKK